MNEVLKRKREDQIDHVAKAAEWIVRRNEDDQLLNPHLEALESTLFERLTEESMNEAVGEATMSAYRVEMAQNILETIAAMAEKYDIDRYE